MAKLHTLVVGRLQTNCYILQSDSTALIIDPGDEPERILRFLDDIAVKPSKIIATHAHFDHVLGVNTIRAELNIPFLIHRDDLAMLESMQSRVRQLMGFNVPPPPKVDQFLADGESITISQDRVKVIHTPGHSPGSISLAGRGYVLTGDALFNQSIGRTDLPGGDLDTLVHSITHHLFSLDDDTIVYPGHGPETSIGDEKLANPFVGQVSKRIPEPTSTSLKDKCRMKKV
jgi:glyoxylase-like metal-dependent hydrolase (beta-lactamase superfamily II)